MARTYPLSAPVGTPGGASWWRRRTALALAAASGCLLGLPQARGSRAWGGELFTAQAINASRFAVLARPVGQDDWNLLVLEQLSAEPRCWTERPDGLIDPSLNRFNFSGICSRYIDSNAYSVRLGDQDQATQFRLRLLQVGDELQLLASTISMPSDLLVGRGRVPLRDRDGFVQLQLEPDWSLQRRAYQGRGLSHLYFANRDNLQVLQARQLPTAPPRLPSQEAMASTPLSRRRPVGGSLPAAGAASLAALPIPGFAAVPGRPIPLPVIPFRE
jgi:Protein of unknown function (DUF3747)